MNSLAIVAALLLGGAAAGNVFRRRLGVGVAVRGRLQHVSEAALAGAGVLLLAWTLWQLLLPCGVRRDCQVDAAVERARHPRTAVDRYGRYLGIMDRGRGRYVSLDSLRPLVAEAFVAAEDRRYYQHAGIDLRGVLRALYNNLVLDRREGASGIAMQAARAILDSSMSKDGTLSGKLGETSVATRLLDSYSKHNVLELYVNTVFLGHGQYGIDAAALYYFGVPAERLTLAQAALLAGIVRSPARLDPVSHPKAAEAERQRVLGILLLQHPKDAAVMRAAQRASVKVVRRRRRSPAADLMAVLGPEKSVPAETLHTTFDLALQETATQRIEWLLTSIRSGAYGAYRRSKTPLQAAYVAFEAGTGEVRAYVSGDPGRPRNIDHLRTGLIRQASTAKGFPLATALEQGMVSLDETVAEIEAKVTPLPSSFWLARLRRASVLDRTLRDALIQSDNYAAVLIVLLVPPSAMTSMKRLGMPVPSTPMAALGTDLVHPLDLAAAYCSFTHGRAVRPTFVTARPTPRVDSTRNDRVWSAHTIASMQGALEGVVRNGTASKAGSALPATARIGGKTGTVDENDEFLFVGYHMVGRDTLCSLLWIGHDRPRPVITKGSAGTVAFPTWAAIGLSTTR